MKNGHKKIIQELIKNQPQTDDDILIVKRKFSKKFKIKLPTNAELLAAYRKLYQAKLKQDRSRPVPTLELLLRKRQVRTLSGVAAIAVLTKPYTCPGKCVYCPTQKAMPKSYLSNEPAVMRAQLCDWHPFKQVALRIKALEANGHPTDKLELIVMGGTWHYLPEKYRLWYIYSCFKAVNNPKINIKTLKQKNIKTKKQNISIYKNIKLKNINEVKWKDLYQEQKKNEIAVHRIVGLTLETRPDYITYETAWQMRELGCTRVEIGVQHIDDKILKLNQRGHTTQQTIRATKILRDLGFKITYHLMPNLPGSTPVKDLAMFKKIFADPGFQPDQIKIYPCVVTKDSLLYTWWKKGKHKPYTEQQLRNLLENIKKIVPYYVRIIRVIRDIPEESIMAGNKITNLRHLLNVQCKCIRCREVGHQTMKTLKQKNIKTKKIKLFIQKYKASGYIEYFLSYESTDRKILYAFCRLRLPNDKRLTTNDKQPMNDWILKTPIIRELHTYGQMVPVGNQLKSAIQHKGYGKKLLSAAEKIAQQGGAEQIAVIAGIGVREYYKKLGYTIKDTYLVKKLK